MPERDSPLMIPDVTVCCEAERIADGDDEVARPRPSRNRRARSGRALSDLHLEHRDIGGLVAADDFGLQVAAVLQGDGDLARVLDDVGVGDDVAVLRVEDHAGAGALKGPVARPGIRRNIEEAAEERVIQQRILRALFA